MRPNNSLELTWLFGALWGLRRPATEPAGERVTARAATQLNSDR